MAKGTLLLGGHTHVPKFLELDNGCFYFNPGSISLPKENNPKTYAIYENRTLTLKELTGKTVSQYSL
jgi:predicted phosphodiesterase